MAVQVRLQGVSKAEGPGQAVGTPPAQHLRLAFRAYGGGGGGVCTLTGPPPPPPPPAPQPEMLKWDGLGMDDGKPNIAFENYWAWPGVAHEKQGEKPDCARMQGLHPALSLLMPEKFAIELGLEPGACPRYNAARGHHPRRL